MKKLFFTLTVSLLISAGGFANTTSTVEAKPDGWIKVLTALLGLDMPDVDYQRGTNKVINGVRHECIDNGTCRIRTGGAARRNVSTSSISTGNHLVKDSNGTMALLINKAQAQSNPDFNLRDGYYLSANDFSFSSIENCPAEFAGLSFKTNVRYDLEELPNHYAIIIK